MLFYICMYVCDRNPIKMAIFGETFIRDILLNGSNLKNKVTELLNWMTILVNFRMF